MRAFVATVFLLSAACTASPPLHPAVSAGSAMTEDLRLSFFENFDDASFRALAERSFCDRSPDRGCPRR